LGINWYAPISGYGNLEFPRMSVGTVAAIASFALPTAGESESI